MQITNEADLYNIVRYAPLGICILDAGTLIAEFVNEKFLEVSGKSYDTIYGKWYWDAFPETQSYYQKELSRVLETGEAYHADEVELMLIRHGKEEWGFVNFVYSPVKNQDGQITKIAVWVLENTLQVKARKTITDLNEALSTSNEQLLATNEELIARREDLIETQKGLVDINDQQKTLVEQLSAAKKGLKFERDRLSRFFMQVPAGICVLDGPEHIYELVNPEYQQLFPGRALLGLPVIEALPELKGTDIEKTLNNVYSTGETFEANALLVPLAFTPDGPVENRYFNFIYEPRLNLNNTVDGILVLVFEVTQQARALKRIEELNKELNNINTELSLSNQELHYSKGQLLELNTQLAENEGYLRMSTQSAGLGTWYIGGSTSEFRPSSGFKEIFGFSAEQELSYDTAILQILEPFRQSVNDSAEMSIIQGRPFSVEYPLIRYNDGMLKWVRSVGKPTFDSYGHFLAFTGVLMDITEQKLDEQRKNDFISMVSHELKTPITSLSGYIQILGLKAKKAEDSAAINLLNKSIRQVSKMTDMINGFLNMSRLESGKIHIDAQPFDMADLLKEAEEESLASITSHHLVFAPVESSLVIADRDKIGQVITNLITNAVKYSPLGSSINIACVTSSDVAMVSVKDEGIGIDQEDIGKLFNRFYRVQNQASISIAGFGIGLYICKEIIERHQGTIAVKSEVGEGSTFYFTLPIERHNSSTAHNN